MAQILVRGLDDRVVAVLKDRARTHGRALESEARTILESAAGYSIEEVRKVTRRWQEHFAGRKMSNSAELLREDRDR